MKIYLMLLMVLMAFIQSTPARDSFEYSQSYTILIGGRAAGREKVNEKLNNAGQVVATSEHEYFMADGAATKHMAFSTKMVLSKGSNEPISYRYEYLDVDSSDFYEVTIKGGQITRNLRRGDQSSEVTVPFLPGMVIVDFNVYHQYDYLIRKYDSKKGGKQSFSNFIPIIGNEIPVNVTFAGDSALELNKNILPVRNFRIEFVGVLAANASVDKSGRLIRLQIPQQDLEVLRDDLLPK
jgi:hypothetical protein